MKHRTTSLALLALLGACSAEPTAPPQSLAPSTPFIPAPLENVIAGADLVVNGSFEQPQIPGSNQYPWLTFNTGDAGLTGWTIESGSVDVQSGEPSFQYTGVPDGSQVVDMNTASISQEIATAPGVTYRVSFDLSENYAILNGAPVTLQVSFGGTSQSFSFAGQPGESSSNMRWDTHSFDVTATGTASTLRFAVISGANGAGGPMIDAVSVQSPSTYTSGADVMTWDPIPGGTDTDWGTTVCTTSPAVQLDDSRWVNPHNAYVLGGHPWAGSYFQAPWINSWSTLQESSLPGLYPNAGFTPVGGAPDYYNWTKYETTVSGTGNYVIQLLADNCSWIYLDAQLVGVQNTDLSKNTYPVTLNGPTTLTFIIFDGGGLAGGKYLLQTYDRYVANGGNPGIIQPPPVPNAAPTVAADGDVAVDEGATAYNTGTVSDLDNDPVTLTASVGTVTDNGDGTWGWSWATTDGPAQSQVVTVSGDDGQGHQVSTTFQLTVDNVAPSVSAGADATLESGDLFALNGSFTDPGEDSPWTSAIDWGDGSSAGGVAGSHTYMVPGTYTVTLSVTDKDGATGSASLNVTVTRKAVGIDIKPGSDVNPINLDSKGVTPVAVLSTADFDATTLDASTVKFGPAGVGTAHGGHIEDVNDDGLDDFLGHFDTDALGLTEASTSACLTGITTGGVHFQGCDTLVPVPPKGKKGKSK